MKFGAWTGLDYPASKFLAARNPRFLPCHVVILMIHYCYFACFAGAILIGLSISAHATPLSDHQRSVAEEPSRREPADASTIETLSLGQVLAATARNSPELAKARVDVATADANVLSAAGVDDWVWRAGFGFLFNRDQVVRGNLVGRASVDSYSLDSSLSRELPQGGTFTLSADGERREQVFGVADDSKVIAYSSRVRASIRQPLLRDRGRAIARANQSRAALGRSIQRLRREQVARDVLRRVIASYWNVALAWRELEIRNNNLALARERRRVTQGAIRGGTAAPTEELAVEQIIATNEENIALAELVVAERSLELRRVSGLEIGPDQIELKPQAVIAPRPRGINRAQVIREALMASLEVQILESRGQDASIAVRLAQNSLLPRLDVTLSAGPQGTAERVVNALTNTAQWKGWQVMAKLSFEEVLEKRAAKGASEKARLDQQQIHISLADARRMVAVEAVRAVNRAEQAKRRMQIGERTISLTRRNIEAERSRFTLGRSTNFDVLQRQSELEQAQLRYARAAVDYIQAEVDMDAFTGRLLSRYGIEL